MSNTSEALAEKASAGRRFMNAAKEILRQQEDARHQARRHLPSGHEALGGKCPVTYLTPNSNEKILAEECARNLKAGIFNERRAYAVFWDRQDNSTQLLTLLPGEIIVQTWRDRVLVGDPLTFKTAARALTAIR